MQPFKCGAQIDLLIDRDDGVVNLCEMKFLSGEYVIDAEEYRTSISKRCRTWLRVTICSDDVFRPISFGLAKNSS